MAGLILTPCTTGTVALYQEADQSILALPVEAWDDAGVPYIAGTVGLVAASTRAGLLRLEAAGIALPPSRALQQPTLVGPRPKPHGRQEKPGV